MQDDYHSLDIPGLLEMLSKYNKEYEELMLRGTKEEFDTCRTAISHLQHELNLRKQAETN